MSSITVQFSVLVDGIFLMLPTTELEVHPGEAARYGLMNEPDPSGDAVVLDAVVAAHKVIIGTVFTEESCDKFLQMRADHWLSLAFGKKAFYSGFTINGIYAYEIGSNYSSQGYEGLSYGKARIKDGDVIELFAFQDSMGMDYYSYFMRDGVRVMEIDLAPGEQVTLKLEGLMYGYGGPMTRDDRVSHHLVSDVSDAQLVTVDVKTGLMLPIEGAVTDEDEAEVTISFDEPGTYYVSALGGEVRYNAQIVLPWLKVNVA